MSTVDQWQPIQSAPKAVGVKVWLWCVHELSQYCKDPVADGYAAPVIGEWIDHNGGGWTWHGLCGVHTHWMPYQDNDQRPSAPNPLPAYPYPRSRREPTRSFRYWNDPPSQGYTEKNQDQSSDQSAETEDKDG